MASAAGTIYSFWFQLSLHMNFLLVTLFCHGYCGGHDGRSSGFSPWMVLEFTVFH